MNDLMEISALEKIDFHRGYLELLEQLTVVNPPNNKITYEQFCDKFDKLNSNIFVIRNISQNKVVACASVFIEEKFIHNLSKVAHVEDVVVNKNYRGYGLGKQLINHCVKFAKESDCYKIILCSNEKNIIFYEKCDFIKKEVQMVKYLN